MKCINIPTAGQTSIFQFLVPLLLQQHPQICSGSSLCVMHRNYTLDYFKPLTNQKTCQDRDDARIDEEYGEVEEKKKELMKKIKLHKYVGETSRSVFERSWEHTNSRDQLQTCNINAWRSGGPGEHEV